MPQRYTPPLHLHNIHSAAKYAILKCRSARWLCSNTCIVCIAQGKFGRSGPQHTALAWRGNLLLTTAATGEVAAITAWGEQTTTKSACVDACCIQIIFRYISKFIHVHASVPITPSSHTYSLAFNNVAPGTSVCFRRHENIDTVVYFYYL